MQADAITWGTIEIPYRYSFSQRKTLGISVHPDLSVTVKAPNGTSPETIQKFVHRRGSWINRAWRDFEQYLPKQPERRYLSGETHRYLGRQYRLKLEQGEAESVKCLRGYLWVTTKDEATLSGQRHCSTAGIAATPKRSSMSDCSSVINGRHGKG